jgi:hypothetical protein
VLVADVSTCLTLGSGNKGGEAFKLIGLAPYAVAVVLNSSLPRHADDVFPVHGLNSSTALMAA